MNELLPHNATRFETDLSGAISQISDVPVPVRDMWNPDTAPEELLPWLAWALSIDDWVTTWTDREKRDAIKAAIFVQKTKGTIGAVKAQLAVMNIDVDVVEWHQNEVIGPAYTYEIRVDASSNAASLEAIQTAIATIDRVKSLRSHMTMAQVGTSTSAGPYFAAVAGMGNEITVEYRPPAVLDVWIDAAVWDDNATWGI